MPKLQLSRATLSKMAQQTHIHQYEKTKWGKNGTVIWQCKLEDCPHYLHVEFILGKRCRCYKCGESFIMSAPKLLRKRPKCDACQHKSGQGPRKDAITGKVIRARRDKKPSIPDLSNINIDDLLENL